MTNTGEWLRDWRLSVNLSKTNVTVTSRKKVDDPEIKLHGKLITVTYCQRHLGVILAANMKWDKDIDTVLSRARRLLGILKKLSRHPSISALVNFNKAYIRPTLEYADIV